MDALRPPQHDTPPKRSPDCAQLETDHEVSKTMVCAVEGPAKATPLAASGTDRGATGGPVWAETETDVLRLGDQILGFTLIERLGQGTFAQVFLAEQEAIAGRRVVLKITSRPTPEPDRLGRLQHPNVVPIHSVHRAGAQELVCMPYLGRTTLTDLLVTERRRKSPSQSTLLAPSGSRPLAAHRTRPTARAAARTIVPTEAGPSPLADVRWILRLLSDLAAGLDHAHRRGILHLDIKPANVLLADAGEPMLLDFNLSHDTTSEVRELVGGTIPYTAPEQLAEMISHERGQLDERTDLYGLGTLAYELLTAEPAFPTGLLSRTELKKYLDHRRKTVPSPRAKNPAVSPAVDAIVCKLLAPQPADRSQTALELKTDIDRHLAHLPLASAPNPSARERFTKWRHRNPWVPLRLALASFVGLALASGVTVYRHNAAEKARAAVAQAWATQAGMSTLRIDLTAPGDSAARTRGRAAAEERLAKYGLPDDAQWRDRREFAKLPDAMKADVAGDLGELLLLLASARSHEAKAAPVSERETIARDALRLNQLAEGCFAPDAVPPFLFTQRARLAAALGESAARPEGAEEKAPRDHYLKSVGLIADGKYQAATRALERVIAGEPGHAAAHFALAYCRQQLGQYTRALERYDTAHALMPRDPRPVFNRGVVYGLQKKHPLAEAEFTLAIGIDPNHGESYRNRGVARFIQKKYESAEADLSAALERNVSPLQVYPLRAQIRTIRDNHREAEQDRLAAKAYEPKTEGDFLTRGRSRLPDDPAGALADFETAARLNPSSLAALQNQAHVWAEYKQDAKRALELITRAADLYPEYAPARAGRAVLLARRGQRDDSHKEAERALTLSADPLITYQLAGVFAQTSVAKPADADRAFALLRQAIRDGFADPRTLGADPDLAPIRTRPEFTALTNALKDITR